MALCLLEVLSALGFFIYFLVDSTLLVLAAVDVASECVSCSFAGASFAIFLVVVASAFALLYVIMVGKYYVNTWSN